MVLIATTDYVAYKIIKSIMLLKNSFCNVSMVDKKNAVTYFSC